MTEKNGDDTGKLLSALSELTKKLETVIHHDFNASEQERRRREILANRSEDIKKRQLDDANRLKDEAQKMRHRWRNRSHDSDDRNKSPDSDDRNKSPDSDENITIVDEYAKDLKEAGQLMDNVKSKYHDEELWLKARMLQLKKEADEIEAFKLRLERSNREWESAVRLVEDRLLQQLESEDIDEALKDTEDYMLMDNLDERQSSGNSSEHGRSPNLARLLESGQIPFVDDSDSDRHSATPVAAGQPDIVASGQLLDESERVTLNVSLVAAETGVFSDCVLRECYAPIANVQLTVTSDLHGEHLHTDDRSASASTTTLTNLSVSNWKETVCDRLATESGAQLQQTDVMQTSVDTIGTTNDTIPMTEERNDILRQPSTATSLETVNTADTKGSWNRQKQKRLLADTVRATQTLRKQLSDILSSYDKEVTYLLVSIENYRQQWKEENAETQRQLRELQTNVRRLEIPHWKPPMAPRKTPTRTDSRPSSELSPAESLKLKRYNPEVQTPVMKCKLSELHRQLFLLHMDLNDQACPTDKETIKDSVTKILKQLLDIQAESDEKRAYTKPLESREQSFSAVEKPDDRSIRLSVELGRRDSQVSKASVVAYVVPLQTEKTQLRRSHSSDDIHQLIKACAADTSAKKLLKPDSSVVSVACERKRSKSVSNNNAVKVETDICSIHEWVPNDVPRYVTEGAESESVKPTVTKSSDTAPTTTITTTEAEESTEAPQTTEDEDPTKAQRDWRSSSMYESSVDSGIGSPTEADSVSKPAPVSESNDDTSMITTSAQTVSVSADDNPWTCEIHLHRYSMADGPAEFCRRSRSLRRQELPPRPPQSNSSSGMFGSLRKSRPSRSLSKSGQKSEIGDTVVAMSMQLMSVVVGDSCIWTTENPTTPESSFLNRLRKANFLAMTKGRKNNNNKRHPPRRTVSEQPLILMPNANSDPAPLTTILRKNGHSNADSLRTKSEADVFDFKKKKQNLVWKDEEPTLVS